jgi:ADP-ribose pyrophosphatase
MSIVYQGRVFSVEVDRRRFPNGREYDFAVVRHPPAVVIIPVEDDGRIVLIRQYRPALDRELWECPAGSLEPGESADAAARRECEEEIGRAPGRAERLGAWYPTPGYCAGTDLRA